jgi:High potential iron-sulfur protein
MSSHDRPEKSNDNLTNPARRRFVTTMGIAAGSVALGALVAKEATAADLPHLQETDGLAVAMNYKEDTAKVDAKKFPNHKATQTCANCQFYQGAATGYGPCSIFAGKAVAAKGWCQVWQQKK